MAFAQDIVMIDTDISKGPSTTTVLDMTTSTPVPVSQEQATQQSSTATKPQDEQHQQQQKPPDYDTAVMCGVETINSQEQIKTSTPPSISQSRAPTATTTPAKAVIPEKTFNDPLRDLILLSEVILIDDEEQFLRNVKSLAEDSSCLDYVLEVKSTDSYNQLQQRKQDLMKSAAVEQGMASLFQNPKEMIDPVKEAEFLKTLEALEDTDDSDAVEKPVLGKISLVRRAKSAATRTSSDKRKSDENPLYNVAWEDIEVSE